jgi:osmoprotectant transport system substrate-binding protein
LEFVTSGTGRLGSASVAAERLRAELAARDIAVLAFARAVDRNAIAMRADRARELGVERISDLAPIGGRLRFVGPPECSERPACLPLLQQIYGIEFASFTPVPSGLSIALELEAGEADVGVMFTSDPLVVEHGLVLLEADRGVPRAENVVPLVRRPVLDGRPDLAEALETVTSRLTTAELVALNTRVARGDAVADVAREWLAAVEREPA